MLLGEQELSEGFWLIHTKSDKVATVMAQLLQLYVSLVFFCLLQSLTVNRHILPQHTDADFQLLYTSLQ